MRWAGGLACLTASWGTPGAVVDGGAIQALPDERASWIWLEDDGVVQTARSDRSGVLSHRRRFERMTVLAIVDSGRTDTACAVYADGSMSCLGSNDQGKLGLGHDADLLVETETGDVRRPLSMTTL